MMYRYLPLMLAAASLLPGAVGAEPIVATTSGRVAGTSEVGVDSFKGIPFAQPPVGGLRWRAPQPVAPWPGVKAATAYGHDCMQVPFPSDAAPLGTPPAEDCLYANVWRPAGNAHAAPLPVIVWIYGGGFVNGGASPPTYSGAELARKGVVFVSFNYRVGRFGTFAHPALTRADEDNGLVGNYGYLDQIAALDWVRRNAPAFGGDRANVTVIGESAGGMSVLALLTSPMAKGLFDKAVVMSGGNGSALTPGGIAGAEAIGVRFADAHGIAADDPQALAKLRALSAEQVTDGLNMVALFKNEQPRSFASPFVDGRIAVDVTEALKSGHFAHIPVMIGATNGDIGGATGYMVAGARSIAGVIAAQNHPVYEYRFSYVASSMHGTNGDTAFHASDIPFFFDTQRIKYGAVTTPRDDNAGHLISRCVVEFARTGAPCGASGPVWPAYQTKSDRLMEFNADGGATIERDPLGARIDAAPDPAIDLSASKSQVH